MSCSKEDIERKRLAAIQRRQSKNGISRQPTPASSNSSSASSATAINNAFDKSSLRTPTKTHSSDHRVHPYSKGSISQKPSGKSSTLPDKLISGTVYLISEQRFEVNPSEFCAPLINIFKTLPSKSYDPSSKLWNFSLEDYDELMRKVAPLAPYVVLGTLPSYILQILRESSIDPGTIDLSPIEATLRHKLMPFQEEGVRFGIAKRGRCMIADDMGLGKTFQALAIASYYRHNWPLLIVTTSSMREIWQSKIHELLPSVPMMNIVTLSSQRDSHLAADKQTDIVITSFKITAMHAQMLKNKKFGVVIIDESHNLKSHKAQCTVALTSISSSCSRIVLLSGSPALSRPSELYTQLHLIHPRLFASYTEYGKRYCAGKLTNFGWDMTGQSNLAELQILLHKKFLIRRTKEQVLTKLEAKTREAIILDHTLLDYSQEDRKELSQMAENYKRTKSTEKHAALLTFFSESARVKIPAVCKYIKQLLRSDTTNKLLIFAHHKIMIEALCLTLDEINTHYICIIGSTPTCTRADLVDKFQLSDSCRVAVLSTTAANSGLTLTAASTVLFAELHWNPGILAQAESRAHRIGQQSQVCVKYLLAASTCDDHMWPMLQGKLNVLNEVGLSKDSFDGTKHSHQESRNAMTQYLSPKSSKNRADYIPGTNIKKLQEHSNENAVNHMVERQLIKDSDHMVERQLIKACDFGVDKSFLDDDEGDQLLSNLNL